jgi:N-acetylglucosamine kinase-like BadF-type ATPase
LQPPAEAHRLLFLGVDGGQTHTIAVLADGAGRLLAVATAGPCPVFDEPGGPERFRAVLAQAVHGAFAAAGLAVTGLAAAGLGLTGSWEHAPAVVQALLPVERLVAVEDTVTAQVGAFAGGPGLVLIAGTGSVAYGRNEAGQVARAGGWGHVLGDEGSGFDIGQQALRAAAQAADKRGPATTLLRQIPAHFGLPHLEAVKEAIDATRLSFVEIAGLAPPRPVMRWPQPSLTPPPRPWSRRSSPWPRPWLGRQHRLARSAGSSRPGRSFGNRLPAS